jgi:hypothetical protein
MAVVGVAALVGLLDSRTPLLIADDMGVRIRLGREWRGLPWTALAQVVVEERDSLLRDGRIVLAPRNLQSALADLDPASRRQVALLQRWYGAPLAVPLALTTRCSSDDLVAHLSTLADGRTDVVQLHGRGDAHLDGGIEDAIIGRPLAEPEEAVEETPEAAHHPHGLGRIGTLLSRFGHGRDHDVDAGDRETYASDGDDGEELPVAARADQEPAGEVAEPATPAPAAARTVEPVSPLRVARRALRAEITRERPIAVGNAALAATPSLVRQLVRTADPVEPLVLGDFVTEPALDPVIGPLVAAARNRAGLSIDQLSDRTRIRPHVLESIEVDDFGPCGGDFYARGHLQTLARFLGLDQAVLLASYDERYAHAPINARRVFEAELATGINGGIRGTLGGPRWSMLFGAVLCLALVWGVARFFTDTPVELNSQGPVVSDSAGLAANRKPITSPLTTMRTMSLRAVRADAHVVVRDRTGRVIWSGVVPHGGVQRIAGLAPFTVHADNAGSVLVKVAGKALGRMGQPGTSATRKVD